MRQSYSICQSRGAAGMEHLRRVAVARVPEGRMSTWLNDVVAPGDVLDVMTPLGSFTCPTRPDGIRHHVAIAAGSGITPVIALLTTALEEEPRSRATLLYGNRRTSSIMFLEELEDLKNRFPGRFQLVTVLSREARTSSSSTAGSTASGSRRSSPPSCPSTRSTSGTSADRSAW